MSAAKKNTKETNSNWTDDEKLTIIRQGCLRQTKEYGYRPKGELRVWCVHRDALWKSVNMIYLFKKTL